MSAEQRHAIAGVCNTIEDVDVSPHFRQEPGLGTGFVQWMGTRWPNKFGGVDTYRVVIYLGQDVEVADRFIDQKVPQIMAALIASRDLPEPLTAAPMQYPLDSGVVSVVVIEGTREDA